MTPQVPDGTVSWLGPVGPTSPNVARVYDAWLGGKSNYRVDREAAARIEAVAPWVVTGARTNREFVARAVGFLLRRGLRQFVDLGSGLPTARNVHEVAQEHSPASRVVYVDHDPVVVAHGRALLATNRNTGMVEGDFGDIASLRTDRVLQGLIDPAEPVGVLATAVLHFIPDDEQAARVVAAWRQVLAPGSHVVVSHVAPGEGEQALVQREAAELYAQQVGPFTVRTAGQVRRLLAGFELVAPGVVPAQKWRTAGPIPRTAAPLLVAAGWLPGGGLGVPKLGNGRGVRPS